MDTETLKDIVIIYHDQCRDGFGAAFAAWKKFGDAASYVPQRTQSTAPDGLENKEIYIVDYSYNADTLARLRDTNESVVVIDHHKTAEAAVTAFSENIFDLEHSGAVLAWRYFHPNTPLPTLFTYIEDNDLWKHELPHVREVGAALGEYPSDFETWDALVSDFENETFRASFIEHGRIIAQFEDRLVDGLLAYKERAEFEGHTIYVLNASRIYRSILGHHLATMSEQDGGAPMGIVYYRNAGRVHCSLRSNGDFDVRALAEKYGGGGHRNSASIQVADFASLPFTFLPDESA